MKDPYLELLKGALTRSLFDDAVLEPVPARWAGLLRRRGLVVARRLRVDPVRRANGVDLPVAGETMIGHKRLDNIEHCVTTVVRQGIPGDLIETGVWHGGACIFMRGVLLALGDTSRCVWVADSFAGLPPPDAQRYPQDEGDTHFARAELAVPLSDVQENFRRYKLLDGQVRFLPGWFSDTLPSAPIEQLAVLRLDGDMYGSTIEALQALYPKVSSGGFVIVDDYGAIPACRNAVEDYRRDHGITEPIEQIDWTGVYWRVRR